MEIVFRSSICVRCYVADLFQLCFLYWEVKLGMKAYNFIKKRLQHMYFPLSIAKFLRTTFLLNTSGGCFCYCRSTILQKQFIFMFKDFQEPVIKVALVMIGYHCVKSAQIRSFFWSIFSCIRTEYGDLFRKSPYSVWIQENTDQKKSRIWTLFTQCIILRNTTKQLQKYS